MFSNTGLRTLCVAFKVITSHKYYELSSLYSDASKRSIKVSPRKQKESDQLELKEL